MLPDDERKAIFAKKNAPAPTKPKRTPLPKATKPALTQPVGKGEPVATMDLVNHLRALSKSPRVALPLYLAEAELRRLRVPAKASKAALTTYYLGFAVYLPNTGHYVWNDRHGLRIAPANLNKGGRSEDAFDVDSMGEPEPRAEGHEAFVREAKAALAKRVTANEVMAALEAKGLASPKIADALAACRDPVTDVVDVEVVKTRLREDGRLTDAIDRILTPSSPRSRK